MALGLTNHRVAVLDGVLAKPVMIVSKMFANDTDLESLQLIRIGGTKFNQNFWHHEGWALRAKPLEPVGNTRDMTDITTELAKQAGILKEYVTAINKGAAGMSLADRAGTFNYALDPSKPPTSTEVWDAVCKAASHELGGDPAVGKNRKARPESKSKAVRGGGGHAREDTNVRVHRDLRDPTGDPRSSSRAR